MGNGGVFCWYSYITPLLTNVSGFSAESVTALMVLAGFGMVVGNLVSGRLSDRYTPGKVGTVVQDLYLVADDIFPVAQPMVFCHSDGALYSRVVCCFKSRTGVDYSCCSRRRDAGWRLCANSVQFG